MEVGASITTNFVAKDEDEDTVLKRIHIHGIDAGRELLL